MSMSDNIKLNLQIDRMQTALSAMKFKKDMNDELSFDFAPYIKHKYNNKFPEGIGQDWGCKIYNFITGI